MYVVQLVYLLHTFTFFGFLVFGWRFDWEQYNQYRRLKILYRSQKNIQKITYQYSSNDITALIDFFFCITRNIGNVLFKNPHSSKKQHHNHSLSFISQAFFPEGQGASLYKYIYVLHCSLCIKTFRDINFLYRIKVHFMS